MATSSSIVAQIAGRYASALFDLSRQGNAIGPVEGDLIRIAALIDESPDLGRFLRSPIRKRDEQERGMTALLSRAGIGPYASNFVRLLARNGRLFALPAAISAFRALAAKDRGEVTANVVSAEPLTPAQDAQLKAELSRLIGATVVIDAKVDQSLLGGLVVRVGSRQIDGSLKTKLDRLAVAMKGIA